jgi:prepilin-type processing-associated H-X9-DG protein
VELAVVVGVFALGLFMLLPAVAAARPGTKTVLCRSHLKQLTAAWEMYAADHSDLLVASSSGVASRPTWMTGFLDYSPAHTSTWDINQDVTKSPLWPYVNQAAALLRCPADQSFVVVAGVSKPRVRSISMNHAFGQGEWLNSAYNPFQTVWRIYGKKGDVMVPTKTFLFADEHPDSINDGSFAVDCTGAEQPGTTRIIDYPASYHNNGACGISFADGRAETHKWRSDIIKPVMTYSGALSLNIPAPGAWVDVSWLAQNTTVRR